MLDIHYDPVEVATEQLKAEEKQRVQSLSELLGKLNSSRNQHSDPH